MQPLNFKELTPTREYLQDIAKVVGKVQQLFVPSQPNDWQKGLIVTEAGLETPPLPGTGTKIVIDFKRGDVSNGQTAWKLVGYAADELLNELANWAQAAGAVSQPETPELSKAGPQDYKPDQAVRIGQALNWTHAQLAEISPLLLTGVTSPILLYPHHFDLSLVWFPLRRDETDASETRQVGLGFSFGDEYIGDAYFYVTMWPEAESFTTTSLLRPAYWQKSGFSGAVVKLNDLLRTAAPEQTLKDFLQTAADGGRSAFGA